MNETGAFKTKNSFILLMPCKDLTKRYQTKIQPQGTLITDFTQLGEMHFFSFILSLWCMVIET